MYIYIYTHTHTHTHIYIYRQRLIHTHLHLRTYTYIYIHIYIYVYICIYILYVHEYVYVDMYISLLALRFDCSPKPQETGVQSYVESYQRPKKVLDTSLLNTHNYLVWIKGKVEQSREMSSALPYTPV